ncbi:MAG: DUF4328 domain-containing protein [Propionicimonas sp.]
MTQPPAAEWPPVAAPTGAAASGEDAAWATYPEASIPAPLATTVGTSQLLPSGFTKVGRALQVLLGLCGVASLVRIGFDLWGLLALRAAESGDYSASGLYDELDAYFSFGPAALMAITGVIWLAWQHRLAAAVPRWKLRRSPGWHVGSWLIPVVSLWFPFQNLVDLHAAVTPAQGERRIPPIYPLWWGLWVASSLTQWVANMLAQQGETTLASLTQSATATAIGEAFGAGAAVFAILVVGDLTRRAVQARDEAVAQADLR